MQHKLKERNIEDRFFIDSAGTSVERVGSPANPLSINEAIKRGYQFDDHISRQIKKEDFADFDLILAMEKKHIEEVMRLM